MSEHTKGPWEFDTDDFVHILQGPNGEHLAEIEKEFECDFAPKGEGDSTLATGLANAHLMAAAPELWEALTALRSFMWAEGYADQTPAMASADAAIAKAEGR
jgi:hypothetical protein